jgi:hypothetical protein
MEEGEPQVKEPSLASKMFKKYKESDDTDYDKLVEGERKSKDRKEELEEKEQLEKEWSKVVITAILAAISLALLLSYMGISMPTRFFARLM